MSAETENKFKAMTQALRAIYSDKDVADYLRWIIKSDSAKEYWASVPPESLIKSNADEGTGL